jgi:hypothetical protein
MRLAAGGATVAVKRITVELVSKVKILPVFCNINFGYVQTGDIHGSVACRYMKRQRLVELVAQYTDALRFEELKTNSIVPAILLPATPTPHLSSISKSKSKSHCD